MVMKKSLSLRIFSLLVLLILLSGLTSTVSAQSKVTLQLHDIKVQPSQISTSYDVSVYFSLFDSAHNAIKDATVENFTVKEDDQPVKVAKVGAENEPINVAILLDTSGSMAGDNIKAARSAATSFIDAMQSSDQVAVLTFDQTTRHWIDFTTDHAAAKNQLALIPEPTPYASTCLFDAAYETILLANSLPSGQRAIILLTDGKDEAGNGQPCSKHTLNDVTSLAASGNKPIPIFTIGLGESADGETLQSIADKTDGRYQYSPRPDQLEALFSLIQDELRSQYGLQYVSTAQVGAHTLTLQVKYQGAEDEVTGKMEMPVLPYRLTFTSPVGGTEIKEKTSLSVDVSGSGDVAIQKVTFYANQAPLASVNNPPYKYDWNPSGLSAGPVKLEAVAQDGSGNELARTSISVNYAPANSVPTALPNPSPISPALSPKNKTLILAAVAGLVLLALVLVVVLVLAARRRRGKGKVSDQDWQRTVQGLGVPQPAPTQDRTLDTFSPAQSSFGALVILQGDDALMINRRVELDRPLTHLGRKADNEIIFAMDSPVSRHHAILEAREGGMFLSEVLAKDEQTGQLRHPAYGTFINGAQIQEPVRLQNGDEIMLGKRLRMRFEAPKILPPDMERTMDQMELAPGAQEETILSGGEAKPESPAISEKTVLAGSPVQAEQFPSGEKTVNAGSSIPAEETPSGEKTILAGSSVQAETGAAGDKPQHPAEESPADNSDKTIPSGGMHG